MREIKFRAWDKEDGTMFFPETDNNSDTFWCGFDGKRGLRAVDPYEEEYPLMQFTGLKDKNEKEIYEGDILEWQWDENGEGENKPIGAVEWLEGDACFDVCNLNGLDCIRSKHYLIIGNIYENPDLVKPK